MVKPGPPRVIVQIRSNVRRPPMNDSRITVNVAFRLSGTMTWRKRTQAPPSRRDRVDVLLGDRQDARDEDDQGDADALPDVDERDRQQRDVRVGEPRRAVDADGLERHVDEPVATGASARRT